MGASISSSNQADVASSAEDIAHHHHAASQPTAVPETPPAPDTFTFFAPHEAAMVQAAAARIIPTDELGPGATEAGVVYFIDRQLSSAYGFIGKVYNLGPFEDGLPTQGDQSMLSMRERYQVGLRAMNSYARQRFGKDFVELSPQEQDQALFAMQTGAADAGILRREIQNVPVEIAQAGSETIQAVTSDSKSYGLQAFFQILRAHTIAGFFADPIHGGNRGLVGWRLIGFPGAQIGGYRGWILNYGVAYPVEPMSVADYQRMGALEPPHRER